MSDHKDPSFDEESNRKTWEKFCSGTHKDLLSVVNQDFATQVRDGKSKHVPTARFTEDKGEL